jgi:hypothetical protein
MRGRENWFECPCCGGPAFEPPPAKHYDGTLSPCGCPTWWCVWGPEEDECSVERFEDVQCMACTRAIWVDGPESEAARAARGEGCARSSWMHPGQAAMLRMCERNARLTAEVRALLADFLRDIERFGHECCPASGDIHYQDAQALLLSVSRRACELLQIDEPGWVRDLPCGKGGAS